MLFGFSAVISSSKVVFGETLSRDFRPNAIKQSLLFTEASSKVFLQVSQKLDNSARYPTRGAACSTDAVFCLSVTQWFVWLWLWTRHSYSLNIFLAQALVLSSVQPLSSCCQWNNTFLNVLELEGSPATSKMLNFQRESFVSWTKCLSVNNKWKQK